MKNIKFSIIIPVYNVEKYIRECLDSVFNQTYKLFEVIVINDGSKDGSRKIIEEYTDNKNLIIIDQENKGLSRTRNEGVEHATGDYILFLDSDDYLETDALEVLLKNIEKEDVIRFQCSIKGETNTHMGDISEKPFKNLRGPVAFEKIVKYKYVENAWLYCYNTNFYKKNNFKYRENFFHEDFGLTPIILTEANSVTSISECIYNYRQRQNSIMTSNSIEKLQKKCNDMFVLGIDNIKKIRDKNIQNEALFLSYIANSLILKGRELPRTHRSSYRAKLLENDIFDYMLKDTLKRRLKYFAAKHFYNLYLEVTK